MAQPISMLPLGSGIKILETVDGVSNYKIYRIMCLADNNDYGHDRVMVYRERRWSLNTTSKSGLPIYENSALDKSYDTFAQQLHPDVVQCFAISNVIVYDAYLNESYTIPRRFFCPSVNEIGGNLEGDTSQKINYFDTNAKRKLLDDSGASPAQNVTYQLRNRSQINYMCGIRNGGIVFASGGGGTDTIASYVFGNIYSNILVGDEPDEDGNYLLFPDHADAHTHIDFECSLGKTIGMPKRARIDLTTEGNPEITSLMICSNYGDEEPVWETMECGTAHSFENTTKTADDWEIGVKVAARGENTIRIYEPVCIYQT